MSLSLEQKIINAIGAVEVLLSQAKELEKNGHKYLAKYTRQKAAVVLRRLEKMKSA